MTLFVHELKKILFAPAIIGLIALSVALNILIAVADPYIGYDEDSPEPYNVFDGYDSGKLADDYIVSYGMTGEAAANMRGKYDKLQPVIDEKARNGDALSVYFGNNTYFLHHLRLFGNLLFVIIAEGCLIAMTASLMSNCYENAHNTEGVVYSSKTGRRILRAKIAASLTVGIAAFTAVLAIGSAVFFKYHDYSSVWNDNVSSSFNFAYRDYPVPFITWRSFTVAQYLRAFVGEAAGLTVVFGLTGFAAGVFFRGGYAACGFAVGLCAAQILFPQLFELGGTARGLLNMTPAMLWLNCVRWFTDGGPYYTCADFESAGFIVSFVLTAAASVIAAKIFGKREIR